MAERKPQSGPSPIYPIIEKFVIDEYAKLDAMQLTPWAFFHSGEMKVATFVGTPIRYNGLRFSGSVPLVFWNGYIEPFLQDIAFRAIDLTMNAATERKLDLGQPLTEVQGQLYSLCRRVYDRMAHIDRNLRAADAQQAEVPSRDIDRELIQLRLFIDKRIDAERRALPDPPGRLARISRWYREHPIFARVIGPVIAVGRHIWHSFGF